MTAIEMFLLRHARMHARVDSLTDGLTEAQVRDPVHAAVNPLAWLVWHMARCEDAAVNALVGDQPQVIDDGWPARLGVARRDVGTGMTMADVRDLSAAVDLVALSEYWKAVGERTPGAVRGLTPADLDAVVGPARVRRAVVERGIVVGAAGAQLRETWSG
jgi:DinB family protein